MGFHVLATVGLAAILISRADSGGNTDDEDYESLYLTPYIEAGQIDIARNLSRVKLFEHYIGAQTHSGYITIDRWKKSNLFFLHIRALKNPDAYPLLLWLQGGPGLSSLFGEFLEIGPLGIDDNGHLFLRRNSLQRHVNVVYLDQPPGAGYSFTKLSLGYANNLDDVASGVLKFLDQFLMMFPEYKNRTFYVGGESYGARFSVGVSHAIHAGKEPHVPLHLRGVILGAGFLGHLMKVADSSEFLYEMSLITKKGRKSLAENFADMRRRARTLIGKLAALLRLRKTIFTSEKKPTLFQRLTGFNNQASALYSEKPLNMLKYEKYVQSDEFKRAVHIGRDVEFMKAEGRVSTSLKNDYLTDISTEIEDLLQSYKVLFYTGQMDTLFPSRNLQEYFWSLNWTGAEEFRKAQPLHWKAYPTCHSVSGLLVRVGRMTDVVIFRAGHYTAVDEPEVANRMMLNFIEDNATAWGTYDDDAKSQDKT
ncbi:probable serine carboxypeptidase CPVL [Dermacentor andersoni]|uniref:probable serine carboxypeptidase CPVL n=1 Tax=Dermacentor andersoni TaxID=34620 RepID=UPI0021555B90|nr:probable serine carboxypeptidase CPVL [Dermacentor andersoni]